MRVLRPKKTPEADSKVWEYSGQRKLPEADSKVGHTPAKENSGSGFQGLGVLRLKKMRDKTDTHR